MSTPKTLSDYDAQIKALQEKRRAFKIAERKRIAKETKQKELLRNAKLYDAMSEFLQHKNLSTDTILSLSVEQLHQYIFNQPTHQS